MDAAKGVYPRRRHSVKTVLTVIGSVLGVIGLGLAALFYIGRRGVAPVRDGQALPGGAVQIKDSFTSAFILDAGPGSAVLIDAGLDSEAKAIKAALAARNLSARAYQRVLKLARTIADLAGVPDIGPAHLAEAIQYRSRRVE